jgi:hypothetical protein
VTGRKVEQIAKWVAVFVSVGTLVWGIISYLIAYGVQAETHALEAKKPFLEYQLQLYKEAVKVAQVLATTDDDDIKEKNETRFWELYYGELGLVENGGLKATGGGVEAAMVRIANCLDAPTCDETSELPYLSLALAHACRNSLAASWGVPDWSAPVYSKVVTTTTPADGASRVSAASTVTIHFNEVVAIASTRTPFKLECPTGVRVGFTANPGWPGEASTFVLKPSSNLPPGVICTVTVLASNIADLAGTPLAADYISSFTVEKAPLRQSGVASP